ncbi:MAG: DUF1801 domain-containing protein [Propionibacteriaceae bacterium]|nr:DUF1801 domain-containing protein [Propionibacteriaceae bacterium]
MSALTDYLESLAEPQRSAVDAVYRRARSLVPEAEDAESYGMPALRYRGKPLLALKVASGHIGLYPFSPEAIDLVREELDGFDHAKGTIRFTAEHPLPDDLVDRVILARRAQIDGKGLR